VTNRISGYPASEPVAPVKGSGNSAAQGVDRSVGEATAAAATPAADQVTLTDSARMLQRLSDAVANAPVVNAQKVAVVKQAVQSGTYQADAGTIADKLLQLESGLK
jgi:negative regulator of flagellin synthesis FlgM